jgi:hypothetical protein
MGRLFLPRVTSIGLMQCRSPRVPTVTISGLGRPIHVTDPTSVVVWCSHTGARSLDQRVCAPPCEAVHLRCNACGAAIGGCPFENPGHHELLARRVFALIGDETLALLVLAIVERAAQAGAPVTWNAARSVALGQLAGC